MEKIKISKTFHYRKDGEWFTIPSGKIISEDEVPVEHQHKIVGEPFVFPVRKVKEKPKVEDEPVEEKPKKRVKRRVKKHYG